MFWFVVFWIWFCELFVDFKVAINLRRLYDLWSADHRLLVAGIANLQQRDFEFQPFTRDNKVPFALTGWLPHRWTRNKRKEILVALRSLSLLTGESTEQTS